MRRQKKSTREGWLHIVQGLDRSGEKPYCILIICIRFHFVNKRFQKKFGLCEELLFT